MYEKIKVLANLELFEGKNMRPIPFTSKYRPVFEFRGARTKISARIDLIDRESFIPGTSGTVQITFLKEMIDNSYFKKGQPFTFSEGGGIDLGRGEILEIIK